MIKPRLHYSYELNTWFCKHPETDTIAGDSPEQAYRKWRIQYDRKKFLENSHINKIWPWYHV
jgi:hypothetical protein